MSPYLAFYKGQGGWIDAAIRTATRSPYSHVELVRRHWVRVPGGVARFGGWASSWRDGGVRAKMIEVTPGHWDFVEVPWADQAEAVCFIKPLIGARYDLAGILGSQILGLRRQHRGRWFCSELVAAALGLSQPEALSPGGLFDRVIDLNRIYEMGRNAVGGVRMPRP